MSTSPEPEVIVVEIHDGPPPISDNAWRERIDARRIAQLERSYRQRTLGQHPFVRPQFISSALPTSRFGLVFGGGGILDQRREQMGSSRRANYLAGAAGADGGIRFNEWVGIDAQITGIAGVSREPEKLVNFGASAGYAWDASVIVRALQRETTALSFRPQVQGLGVRGLALNPGFTALSNQLAAGGNLDLIEAARYTTTMDTALGGMLHVALAQSITRFVGLQIGVAGGGQRQRQRSYDGEDIDAQSTRGLFQSGLALSVDTHPVPLAIMAEYNFKLGIGTGDQRGQLDMAHNVGGGVYFNALTQVLGVSVAANLEDERGALLGMFTFRGYF
ncbi:hypothetical protein DB30_07459 [Enhygromyxa salina]|uniref:Uncharacterized protein n=1 Tax=Enhygromyxa salina TaxID=215803 RepID=A0A0C2CRU4_9BACT|nr:hypothetical protein [Enhygromyxa salina]KIG13906.1 hypothetical protein DB30_07459 [Enhygromyxa salina]